MSFYEWCIEKYYEEDSPKGDLAADIKNDVQFPKESISKIEIEVYLMSKKACDESIKILGGCMRESTLEKLFVKEVKNHGGLALKFVSPGMTGVPDRIVLLPHGVIAFIELKAPGKKMRPIQIKRKGQLESLGFKVYCIDNKEQIGGILDAIEKR